MGCAVGTMVLVLVSLTSQCHCPDSALGDHLYRACQHLSFHGLPFSMLGVVVSDPDKARAVESE